jgi:hypothetical protein
MSFTSEQKETVLGLVKERRGIRASTARDTFILAIIESILSELEDEKGLVLDGTNSYHLMFVTDYADWRYKGSPINEWRPIQFRLHNMMIRSGGGTGAV